MWPQSPNVCKMQQPWEGTVTYIHMAPGVFTAESVSELNWILNSRYNTLCPVDISHLSVLVFLFPLLSLNWGACLDIFPVNLPFCHISCLLAIFFVFCSSFAYFSPLQPFAFSPLRSKVTVAFPPIARLYKAFGFGLPLLFSWEMAEAVFRERAWRIWRRREIWFFLNEIFCYLSLKYLDKSSKFDIHIIQTVKMRCLKCALQLWS